jgi:cell division protein FtsQ
MSISNNIRRILLLCAWILTGSGVIVLLIAAVHSRSEQVCKGYEITIANENTKQLFVDKNDILNVITAGKTTSLKNKAIKSIDLNRIEARLKREVWVNDAELFFDNNGILKISVLQRVPVARVFTSSGESFYIDSNCKKLPVSIKSSAKLPVFTGYPFSNKKMLPGERKLLNQVKQLGMYIANDPFWMAQIAQADITPSRDFELVPTVGNHIIEFGSAAEMVAKFDRLMTFYKQVLVKTGMDKYERLKVQYTGQVIGVKAEAPTKNSN